VSPRDALEHLTPAERDCVRCYLRLIREQLSHRLLEVYLFGSFARADMWPPDSPNHSDIDLLAVCGETPSPAEIEALVNATYPLFLECGRQISTQFRTPAALQSPTTDAGRGLLTAIRDHGRLLFRS
jgi:hypothetical protein